MTTPSQAAQLEEARNRTAGLPEGEADPHQTPINDSTGETEEGQSHEAAPRGEEGNAEPEPYKGPRMSPADEARANIAKRFKRDNEGNVPYNGDPNDPEMMYGKVGRAPDADPEVIEPEVVAPVAKRTLNVRGQQVEMTDEEILAAAQKVTAADSYLKEARELLESAKGIKQAERAGQDRRHPDGQSSTRDDDLDTTAELAPQHPGDELVAAIEDIQFGDPKDAAAKIRKVIAAEADSSADERQMKRLVSNDLANSKKVLLAFRANNPDLDQDKLASMAIENTIYDIYREDITKLGIDEAQLPKDPSKLADWHRFYRINGHPVQKTEDILNEAKSRFNKWRGVSPKPAAQQARVAPRIEVSVDRDARRASIPSQPTRTVSPQPNAAAAAPQGSNRSDVVMQMRKARGQATA